MQEKTHYTGLSEAEVAESRARWGVNVLTPPKKTPLWLQFLEKFSDPLIIILMVAGVLSIGIALYERFGLGDGPEVFFEPVGIFIAIFLATGLAFYFERNADKAFSLLNKVGDDELVKVIRGGHITEVPKRDVVVGDIVVLATGDEVPADGELLESTTLQIDESTLTGEPVCPKSTDERHFDPDATYPTNFVLRGTKVMEGHGVYRVTAVGDRTENGKVFVEAQIDSSVKTPLNEQLEGLSALITHLSYTIAAAIIVGRLVHFFDWQPLAWTIVIPTAVFFWLVIKKFEQWSSKACIATIIAFIVIFVGMIVGIHHVLTPGTGIDELLSHTLQTLMIAVTLIVVSVPEGLPMAVTLSLAYSMRSMLKTQNLVRKMHACETMGATTVICTDKTGTLTQNKMQVSEARFFGLTDGKLEPESDVESRLIIEGIAVNSTASLDLTGAAPTAIGNPTEGALLLWLHSQGVNYEQYKAAAHTIAEVPFSTERKYMATEVQSAVMEGKRIIYVKGAPEIVFGLCKHVRNDVTKDEIDRQLLAYQNQAMRTLGFACQIVDEGQEVIDAEGRLTAKDLTFLGIVAISDPVRADVPEAVKECMDAGISIKIVTGDTPATAREIGRQIGLWHEGEDLSRAIITGPEFAALTDEELRKRILNLKIIARARPMDKKRLVETLADLGQVVAVTGDGTNDAPALKAAHVGLSMGDGTSVAKEASDITIIDNSFSSIGRAVMWGRSLYQNIQRFLLFQLTVNVSACLIVLVGAFMGTESPLTVTQMLWINLIMDTFGAMALASLPPSPDVMHDKPRRRTDFILNRPMYGEILGVGIAFFLMLVVFLFLFEHYDVRSLADLLALRPDPSGKVTSYEQTLLFSIFVWTHFWYMFNARAFETGKSIFSLRESNGFRVIVGVIILGQIVIVECLSKFFDVEPMLFSRSHPNAWIDFILIVVLSSVVLWIRELWHLLTSFFRSRK